MTKHPNPLEVIELYFEAFREGVKRCREAEDYHMAEWQDAYARLYRLRERFLNERSNLKPIARNELEKVFVYDTFIEGMMDLRTIGDHVTKRREPVLYIKGNVPVPLVVEVSALEVFGAPVVTLSGKRGSIVLKHLEHLDEAELRIAKAIHRAKKA